MARLKRIVRRKAVEATVHHVRRGIETKVRRQPMRTARLLGVGVAIGGAAGWFAGRKTA